MERHPKLDLVIEAISEAKKITPKGQEVKVYLSNVLKHKQFRLQELKDILTILEDDEKILTLMIFPRYLLKLDLDRYSYRSYTPGDKSWKNVDPSKEYFTVKLHKRFDKWCTSHFTHEDDEAEKISKVNLKQASEESSQLSEQELNTILQSIDDNPQGFLDELLAIGRNPHTEALIKSLFPEITSEELDALFGARSAAQSHASLTQQTTRWRKSRVPWDTKKVIWQRYARGESLENIRIYLELHQDELRGVPFDRATIKKVIDELREMPNELKDKLISELPEIKSVVR
ncbi:MAG: hypothetical protein WBE46_01025 [Dehalococcoidia bacterium]